MAQDAGGGLVGASVVLLRRDSPDARLYSLAVHPSMRGQGIGAALVKAAENKSRKAGKTGMRLEVRADNTAAIDLYLAHGYVRFAIRPGFYADGMSALRMRRTFALEGQ